ncbi:MAG TPA: protein kinase, partial [Chlamydiales bacterium]|nr:protein kinase [Chlamydiales bacterium]
PSESLHAIDIIEHSSSHPNPYKLIQHLSSQPFFEDYRQYFSPVLMEQINFFLSGETTTISFPELFKSLIDEIFAVNLNRLFFYFCLNEVQPLNQKTITTYRLANTASFSSMLTKITQSGFLPSCQRFRCQDDRIIEQIRLFSNRQIRILLLNKRKEKDLKFKGSFKTYSTALILNNAIASPIIGRATLNLTKIIRQHYEELIKKEKGLNSKEEMKLKASIRNAQIRLYSLKQAEDSEQKQTAIDETNNLLHEIEQQLTQLPITLKNKIKKLTQKMQEDIEQLQHNILPRSIEKTLKIIENELKILDHLKDVEGVSSLIAPPSLYLSNKREKDDPDVKLALYFNHHLGDSLIEFITKQQENLSYTDSLDIALQSATILRSLKEHNVLHQDIKLENIVIEKDDQSPLKKNKVFMIDFGLAKKIDQTFKPSYQISGTPTYLSPEKIIYLEAIKKARYAKKHFSAGSIATANERLQEIRQRITQNPFASDLFSLALCIFQILKIEKKSLLKKLRIDHLKRFKRKIERLQHFTTLEELFAEILNIASDADLFCAHPPKRTFSPKQLAIYRLIGCLRTDPAERTTVEELTEALEVLLEEASF